MPRYERRLTGDLDKPWAILDTTEEDEEVLRLRDEEDAGTVCRFMNEKEDSDDLYLIWVDSGSLSIRTGSMSDIVGQVNRLLASGKHSVDSLLLIKGKEPKVEKAIKVTGLVFK
ncbi:MAG: hypothetical protein PVG39_04690 [Desulfobacteraceae bacterium]|jgi:hypothetical protein